MHADYIDSNFSLQTRDKKVEKLKSGETWILVTTDVLSRGIDVSDLKLVINFDFPQNVVDYIHRVGRTGRVGKRGRSVVFYGEEDRLMLRKLAEVLRNSGVEVED